MIRRLILILLFVSVTGAVASGAGLWAWKLGLDDLAQSGRASLTLASDRLVRQLERFRELPVLLADHPLLLAEARGAPGTDRAAEASRVLESVADLTGALEIWLVDAAGQVRAGSSLATASGTRPRNLANQPDFRRAMTGALGYYHAQPGADAERGFFFSAPVRDARGTPAGAVMVKVDLEALESEWRGDPGILFFTDVNGVVFLANRDPLLLRVDGDLSAVRAPVARLQQYPVTALKPWFEISTSVRFGHELWRIDAPAAADLPQQALHLEQPLPLIAMRGRILIDTRPATVQAWLWGGLAAALMGMLALAMLALWERRRALSVRLETEERANAELERRVADRTSELVRTNDVLRQEVADRKAAEDALRRAQADLVQAGKLAALGQLSAGISHELNQPLAAIHSYAENAEILMARDRTAEVRENLSLIVQLSDRMARIIRNLRAFSRKEGEPATVVVLNGVVDDALALVRPRFDKEGVAVDWMPPAGDVLVHGGGVRLQQVVLNLLTNAADAMRGQAKRTIHIRIETFADRTELQVRDSGPGLQDADRIFEPFYTTKSAPGGEGMGLGLSISYGIVQSFGGDIRGENVEGGGALFRVILTPVDRSVAA
ncbi:sensor histidine kinase [Rhodobacteraceae bacterium KN286]|uniref:C4-dicarboxylate transport sensor protein DctB n=2 Tax=Oceanomicrobium pacificus TaxID=2692916 RepID=A0A6B0U5G9_9RHOB|nr:sensor histidine kinase [Oceanomicrobium pacificus]